MPENHEKRLENLEIVKKIHARFPMSLSCLHLQVNPSIVLLVSFIIDQDQNTVYKIHKNLVVMKYLDFFQQVALIPLVPYLKIFKMFFMCYFQSHEPLL